MPNHDLAVIGGGPAGIGVAVQAAARGLSVALFERGRLGGTAYLAETVPLQVLARLARKVALARDDNDAVRCQDPVVNWPVVRRRVEAAQNAIAESCGGARLASRGITVVQGSAYFTGTDRIEAGGQLHSFGKAVIATGRAHVIPDIPGLASCSWLTPDRLLALPDRPEHLLILGGGTMAAELAQCFARLGSRVTLVTERPNILERLEPEARLAIRESLRADGVEFSENTGVVRVADDKGAVELRTSTGAALRGTHLVLAQGRHPDLQSLDLPAAQLTAAEAIPAPADTVKATSNGRIWVLGPLWQPEDTEAAPWLVQPVQAAMQRVTASIIGHGSGSARLRVRVVRTDPGLVQLGLTEAEAREAGHRVTVTRLSVPEGSADYPLSLKLVHEGETQLLGLTLLRQDAPKDLPALRSLQSRGTVSIAQLRSALDLPPLLDPCAS